MTIPYSPVRPSVRPPRVSIVRLLLWGLATVVLAAAAGFAIELSRFGRTDAAAARVAEQSVREDVSATAAATEQAAASAAGRARLPSADDTNPDAIRSLFDVASDTRGEAPLRDAVAVTIYDAGGSPLAWSGRASDLPADRIHGGSSLFIVSSPLGLRLVSVRPITATPANPAMGSAVAEHEIAPAPLDTSLASQHQYTIETPVGPVSLTPDVNGIRGVAAGDYTFAVESVDRVPLVRGRIRAADLAAARAEWRQDVEVVLLALGACVLLLLTGPLLDRRNSSVAPLVEFGLTAAIVALVAAAGAVFWYAQKVAASPEWHRPLVLLIFGGTASGIAAAAVSGAVRLRLALRLLRRWVSDEPVQFVVTQLLAGVVLAASLAWMERLLGRAVDPQAIDLRHFSLHPWSGPRLASLAGMLLGHAAALWGGSLVCVVAISRWRLPRHLSAWHAAAFVLWVGPVALLGIWAPMRGWPVPGAALILGALAMASTALMAPRLTVWYRQTTVVSRILALFLAFLLPALLIYPSVAFFVDRSTRRVIETRYAVETIEHPARLLARLQEALAEIDAQPFPADAIDVPAGGTPRTDPAFSIWNKTALARNRLTSDVELFDSEDNLVSRFALNFPEYTGSALKPQGRLPCQWDVFSEAQPFGADERRMLHAQRSVCGPDGTVLGAIIVHVVFDYRTLSFITSQSPYYEALRGGALSIEGQPSGDVDIVVYGWSLRPIYMSGSSAWPLDEATFDRIYRSRTPFWTSLEKDGNRFNVYISNDRGGIYALGYPVPDLFEHLVRLAELTTLAGTGYVIVLILNSVFTRLSRGQPLTGRALLREIRVSFYRKLFLAFVLASIVPVLILALVIRTYFANLLYESIAGEAARIAAVAQRVIGESDALLRRGAESLAPFGDDVMVWISQVINQDVNIFYGPELSATSERDLFASGLLPTRVPEDVYRAIVLQRLPSFVSEDRVGDVPYLLASTGVRTGSRQAILTVPLALRQREVEREIDELDRGVHLAALCFILLGAAIGLSMAERIADPVRRLTRATGRIAGGDFDARIAVRSSDELRRLVDAFNSMAAELKAQRAQLERTHRIEAWAEMARQVAHEIKNPLTPIQLSAEHLRRVHEDRGMPLSPVLENCVDTILGQVRLLRQISAEFSSFASSPTARPAPADPVELVRDVVDPYRHGLTGRIDVRNEVAGPLPRIFVDRTLVSRALANIVENALHAMPGQGALTITSRVAGAAVVIDVTDTGVGMDPDALARVFEPYFSTKATGTGLGLPIARRNIELSGGTIQVDSEKGRGTRVTLILPVAESPATPVA